MTTERFDIEVRDSVAKSIRTELTAIGAAARSTHGMVQQLNRELSNGARAAAASAQSAAVQASGAAARTAAAQARATAETARATAAEARLTAERAKSGIAAERLAQAEAKTALAKQKVATEAARTAEAQSRANIAYLNEEAALNRAVSAEQRAVASKERLAAASVKAEAASQRQTVIHDRSVIPQAGESRATSGGDRDVVSRQTEIMRGSTAAVQSNTQAMAANASAAQTAGAAQTAYSARVQAVGNSSRLAAQHSTNLLFQLNDIFVSLASGQKPMMVAIQQGAQIAQINQQAGLSWREMGVEMLMMLRILQRTTDAEAAAELAAASLAARNLATSAAVAAANLAQADTEIAIATAQRQAATTAAELAVAEARLAAAHEAAAAAAAEQAVAENALAAAQGRQAAATSAANASTTTRLTALGRGGVVVAGVLATAALAVGGLTREANQGTDGLRKYTEEMGYSAKEVQKLNSVTVGFGDTAKAVFQVGLKRILGAFGLDVQAMANGWNSAMNWMARAARVTMGGAYALVAGTASAMAKVWKAGSIGQGVSLSELGKSYTDAYDDANKFMDDVVAQARTNARGRQDEMAQGFGANAPSSRKGSTGGGWDRAKELRDANAELDVQIGLLGKYGSELERAQQIEQIGRQFREHGKPLTATEIKALEDKIRLLQEGARVQTAMTAAEEVANGPSRAYEATQEALSKLLAANAINQAEYNRQLKLAERAFEDATDPLAAMNRELEKNSNLISHYGRSRDLRDYIEQMRQAAESQGRSIYQPGTAAANDNGEIVVTGSNKYTPEAQRMIDEYQRQQKTQEMTSAFERIDPKENQDVGGTAYILDNYREMYAEIQRFREEDVRNEEEAARRKQNLDRAVTDAKLTTASGMFGQLASLQNSHNKQVAAIGKAAAIAQATIDGYKAVQAALAGPPGPPWSFAIAGVTAAMTAANVAKIAGIGFQRGGYTGDGDHNDVAGPAHRGEFIFDGAATRRIGVPALEALRSGRTFGPGQAASGSAMGGRTSVSVGQINVRVEGKADDPQATGDAVQRGVQRALRNIAKDEIKSQQRDGGLLSNDVMAA